MNFRLRTGCFEQDFIPFALVSVQPEGKVVCLATEVGIMSDSFFLTSIGIGPYEHRTYTLREQSTATCFAPVAAARLLNLSGSTALILVTEEAEKSRKCSELQDELREADLLPQLIPISASDEPEALMRLLSDLADRVPDRSRLTLDVTAGFRHLPFLYFAVLTFLCGLKHATLEGIYYGAHDLRREGTAPILSIGHIFNLVEWFYALRAFRDSGDAQAIARSLKDDVKQLFVQNIRDFDLSKLKDDVRRLAEAIGLGLPLEAGIAAGRLTDNVQRTNPSSTAPASYLAVDTLRSAVSGWKLAGPLAKHEIGLDNDELRRQLAFADWLIGRGDLGSALRLIREFMVNLVLFNLSTVARWLDYNPVRVNGERYLNALNGRAKSHLLTAESERKVAALWSKVAELRNRVAHAGMTPDSASIFPDTLREWLSQCRTFLDDHLTLHPFSGSGAVLVTPLGKSPGVLFSALMTTNPDRLILVTSQEALAKLEEIKREAGYTQINALILTLDDPHAGFDEIALPHAELERVIIDASDIIVNITGGTTALQWAVERIAERANRLGASVKRIALVDRRPLSEQQANPYVVGQRIDLEPLAQKTDFD
jgi:hypothetical protein